MSSEIGLRKIEREDTWYLTLIVALVLFAALPSLLGFVNSDPAVYQAAMQINANAPSAAVPAHFLPGQPVVDQSNGATTQALGYRAAKELLHGRMPWWNEYTGVGLPLAAEYQPAAFFPLTFLLLLPQGVLLESLALQIIAGWGLYALLRQLNLGRLAAVTGGVLFAFNGTTALFGVNGPTLVLPFLPWMLLGVERAWIKARMNLYGGWRMLAAASALTLLAGFPETAYLNGLLVLAWSVLRLAQSEPHGRLAFAWRIALGGAIGIALVAPQIFVFFQSLPLSDLFSHTANVQADVHLSADAAVPTLIAPRALVPAYAAFFVMGGYVTGAMIIAATYGFMVNRSPLAWLLLGWAFLALGKMFGLQPMTFLWNLVPGVGETMTSRYLQPTLSVAIIVLAAQAIENLVQTSNWHWKPFLAALLIALIAIGASAMFGFSVWKILQAGVSSKPVLASMKMVLVAGLGWAAISAAVCLCFLALPARRIGGMALACLLMGEAVVVFSVSTLNDPPGNVTVDRPAIQFLSRNLHFNRFYTLSPFAANYGAYYGIASIDTDYLPVSKRWLDWIHLHLDRTTLGDLFVGDFLFRDLNPPSPLDELKRNLLAFEWTGVKYIVSPPEGVSFAAGIPTDIHPRTLHALNAIRKVYADRAMTIYELPDPSPYFEVTSGQCKVTPHKRTSVAVDCVTPTTLVRRELFYPGWSAQVNGADVAISVYGDLFQSIAVPRGHDVIRFDYVPPHIVWMWFVALIGFVTLTGSGLWEVRRRGVRWPLQISK